MIKGNTISDAKSLKKRHTEFVKSGRTEIFSKAHNMLWREEKEGFSKFLERSDTLNSLKKKDAENKRKEEEKETDFQTNKRSSQFKNRSSMKSSQKQNQVGDATDMFYENSNHIIFKDNYEIESNELSPVSEHNEQIWESSKDVEF